MMGAVFVSAPIRNKENLPYFFRFRGQTEQTNTIHQPLDFDLFVQDRRKLKACLIG